MSDQPTLVTMQHFDYIAARTRPDDDFLVELKAAAAAAGLPPIWIGPAQASFMGILLRLCGARRVVEVGTLAGYSAITMARALPADGHLDTIELDPQRADFAEAWIARSDVAGKVSVLRGTGDACLAELADTSVDAMFLDADKAGYAGYLEAGLRILRPGGLMMADNAFAFGQLFDAQPTDREAAAVLAFNEVMAGCTEVDGVIVPMGDGLWVGVKNPG
jgi:predicted O-methyltransferase YrrM